MSCNSNEYTVNVSYFDADSFDSVTCGTSLLRK